jgi:two-component sensor histidine kinase
VNAVAALVALVWRNVVRAGKVCAMMNFFRRAESTATQEKRDRKFVGVRVRHWRIWLIFSIFVLCLPLFPALLAGLTSRKFAWNLFSWGGLLVSVFVALVITAIWVYFEKRAAARLGVDIDFAYKQDIFHKVQSRTISVAGNIADVQKRVIQALIEYRVLGFEYDDEAEQIIAVVPSSWDSVGDQIKIMLIGSDPCEVHIQVSPISSLPIFATGFARNWEHLQALATLINSEPRVALLAVNKLTVADLKAAANTPHDWFMAGARQRMLIFVIIWLPTLLIFDEPGKPGLVAAVFSAMLCAEIFAFLKFRLQVQRKIRTESQESFEAALVNGWGIAFLFLALFTPSKSWLSDVNLGATAITCIFTFFAVSRFIKKKKERVQRAILLADRDKAELERQLSEAKLVALSAQIEPHFLFNTLASIQYLIRNDTHKAGEMTSDLIRYLRLALPRMKQSTARLADELELVRAYLGIMQIRMGARLQFAIDAPDDLSDVQIPTMTLITLVENAIKHGLEQKPDGGAINLKAILNQQDPLSLRLEVADTGGGFSSAVSGTGIGLVNIRERLSTLYRGRASLELEANQPSGVKAILILPIERK